MEKYDYERAVREDVREWINEHEAELSEKFADGNGVWLTEDNADEVREYLYDRLFVCDAVTGNESGSYTFNAWRAEEYLCHNMELLGEALEEFCCDASYILKNGVEACDVTIRCYLLGGAISEVIDEMIDNYDESSF